MLVFGSKKGESVINEGNWTNFDWHKISRPKFPLKTWQDQEAQQTKESFISECINLTFPMEFVKQLSELITTP